MVGAYDLDDGSADRARAAGQRYPPCFRGARRSGLGRADAGRPFTLLRRRRAQVRREQRDPADYGLPRCEIAELLGADAAHNASELRRALSGGSSVGHRDALLLGAALALEVAGIETTPERSLARARAALQSGTAAALLQRLQRFGAEQGNKGERR